MAPTKRRVFVFGHSHLGAIESAYPIARSSPNIQYELKIYQFLRPERPHIVNQENKGWRYNPQIEDEITSILANECPDAVAIMLQGEQAVLAGLVAPVCPYDFFFPDEIGYAPEPDAEIIPFDVATRICRERFRLIEAFLDKIKPHLPRATFAVSPPPIVGDRQFILDTETKHADISANIKKFGLPLTTWRQRIWKLHCGVLKSIYSERHIAFIDAPALAIGNDGCLRTEFRADIFHANAKYGNLLLDQINDLVKHA